MVTDAPLYVVTGAFGCSGRHIAVPVSRADRGAQMLYRLSWFPFWNGLPVDAVWTCGRSISSAS